MDESIVSRIAKVRSWYHRIPMPDGSLTPGVNDTQETLKTYDALGLPQSMENMRVLDIGCADGFYSFLAEERGAKEVVSVDYRLPTASGFSVARDILQRNAQHVVDNVYNLDPGKYGQFDLVLFLGVLYHLRNPLLALDKVRSMAKPGALVLVESHVIDLEIREHLAGAEGTPGCSDAILSLPLWRFYLRGALAGDLTNKWAPSMQGLVQVCEEAQLAAVNHLLFGSRGAVLCRAVSDIALETSRQVDSFVGLNAP